MKKIVISVFLVVAIFLAALFALPAFINIEKNKKLLTALIENKINYNLEFKGKYKIEILPLPKITAENVIAYTSNEPKHKILQADKIEFYPGLLDIFSGKLNLAKVNFYKALINYEIEDKDFFDLSFFKKLQKQNSDYKIHFKDSELDIKSNNFIKKFDISSLDFVNKNNIFSILGQLIDNDIHYNINYSENTSKIDDRGSIKLESKNFDIFANVKLSNLWNEKIDKGKFELSIKSDEFFVNKFSNLFPWMKQIGVGKFKDFINLQGELELEKSMLAATEIAISSKDNLLGSANLKFIFDKKPQLDFLLDIEKFDIDNFYNKETANNITNEQLSNFFSDSQNKLNNNFINLSKGNKIKYNLELNIRNAVLHDSHINNFELTAIIDEDVLSINNLHLKYEDGLNFTLANTKNIEVENIPVLVGDISFDTNNLKKDFESLSIDKMLNIDDVDKFTFNGKLILSPDELTIDKLYAKFAEESQLNGRWTIKKHQNNFIYNIRLDFYNVDLAKFHLPKLHEKINILLNDSDKRGYLAEYRWLREINNESMVELSFNKSKYKDINVASLGLKMNVGNGTLNLKNFHLFSDIAYIDNLELSLDARALRPKIKLIAEGQKLDLNILKEIMDGQYENNISNNKPKEEEKNQTLKWSKEKFNFFRFDKFDGLTHINFDNFVYKDLFLNKVNLTAKLQDDVLLIDNLEGQGLDGSFNIKGNYRYGNDGPTLALSYSLSEISLKKLFNFFSDYNIDGIANFTGSMYTYGYSPYDWSANFSLNSSFKAIDLIVNGIDIQNLVDISSKKKYVAKDNIINEINENLRKGTTKINHADGNLIAKDGKLSTNNLSFESYYSKGVIAAALDLKNWLMNTIVQISFNPKTEPITLSYNLVGNIDNFKTSLNQTSLLEYIRKNFGFDTKDDKKKQNVKSSKNFEYIYEQIE